MKIAIVMPVYNEETIIEYVIDEWMEELCHHNIEFCLIVINDGSKDNTAFILESLSNKYKDKLIVINKNNSGHGQSCIFGYKHSLSLGYDWIFQIDSDGQCDPLFFGEFVKRAIINKCIYGYRKKREDGFKRLVISRFVSLFIFLATCIWVRDANVPYRLMHKSTLINILDKIPTSFYLANILVSVLQVKESGIFWIDINFKKRIGGEASVKSFSFFKHGITLFKQLKNVKL